MEAEAKQWLEGHLAWLVSHDGVRVLQVLESGTKEERKKLAEEIRSEPDVPKSLLHPWPMTEVKKVVGDLRDKLHEISLQCNLPYLQDWHAYFLHWGMWKDDFSLSFDDYDVLHVVLCGTTEFSDTVAGLEDELKFSAYRWYPELTFERLVGVVKARKLELIADETSGVQHYPDPESFFLVLDEFGCPSVLPFSTWSGHNLDEEEEKDFSSGTRGINVGANRPMHWHGYIDLPELPEPQHVSDIYPLPEYIVEWTTLEVAMQDGKKIVSLRIDCENPTFELPVVVAYLERQGFEPYRDDDLPLNSIKVDVPKSVRKELKIEVRRVLERLYSLMGKAHKIIAKEEGLQIGYTTNGEIQD